MKQKLIFIVLMTSLLALNSCDEETVDSNEKYSVGDHTGSMANAKIYWGEGDLALDGNNDDFTQRTYFISDGDFESGGDLWDINNYTDATYFFAVELYVPSPAGFTADEYPSWRINYQAPADQPFSYLEFYFTSTYGLEAFQSVTDDTAVITASGKFNSDETLTLELSGQIGHTQNSSGTWGNTGMIDVSMNVTARVIDIR